MYDPIKEHLPIGFSMALAHNPIAFDIFLKVDDYNIVVNMLITILII